jgi:hypothetical protein
MGVGPIVFLFEAALRSVFLGVTLENSGNVAIFVDVTK